jgi:hypothetical protein
MKQNLRILNDGVDDRIAVKQFPIVEFNYHPVGLSGFNTRCAGRRCPSFQKISYSYFRREARRNLVIETLLFTIIAATTAPAIMDCVRALVAFMHAVGGV